MIKVEDILNLDLDKISSAPLKEAIKSWMKDYNKESDKKLFAKESQENIDKLFGMVKQYAPKAIKEVEKETVEKEPKGKSSKIYKMSDGFKWKLLSKEEAKKYFNNNKEVYGLNRSEESESLIKTMKDLNDYDEFGVPFDKEKLQSTILTEELVREVINELTDIEIDLDGQDETIIATTRLELEEALEETEQAKLHKKVEKAADNFKDWAMDIANTKAKKATITSMNKLFNALGEPLLNADGKEQKESEKERSKRILAELNELKPELDRCRAVVSEANKKKREAEGAKPKKTRLTQLKNKLLSIAGLIPPQLKDNLDVQKKTEKILLTAHKELVSVWGMDKVKAKPGADAIKEKFGATEEKKEVEKKIDVPTEKEIIKHLGTLSVGKFVNDAAYILSGDLDRMEARITNSKGYREEVEKELAKKIIASDSIETYLKEIGYKK